MLEAFDPATSPPAKSVVDPISLSDAAMSRMQTGLTVRQFLDRLLHDNLTADAVQIIAQALPAQYVVAWGCECARASVPVSGPLTDGESVALALAEQCLKDPTEENRRLCLDLADRSRRDTAGAWLATAAAWADGNLAPPGSAANIPAPPQAVSEAVVAALKMFAARAGVDAPAKLSGYARRALTLFGPRPPVQA